MKVMLTGATGFVGSHLADTLQEKGHQVTALVRTRSKAARLVDAGACIVDGDLDDPGALRTACEGQDVIFHVAGLVAARNETEFMRVNRDGTRGVAAAASRVGTSRLVLVSSLAAAGPSEPGHPLAGHETPAPVTAYGRSKLAAEEVVRLYGLAWTVVRPPLVYGPRDTEVFKVFQAASRGVVPVFGSRHQELSAVYVTDLAEALVRIAEVDRTIGRTYHACHPEIFTSEELGRAVGEALGRGVRVIRLPAALTRGVLNVTGMLARISGRTTILNRDKANELLQSAWTGDPALLERDTGWVAGHDLVSGVRESVIWYRENGWL